MSALIEDLLQFSRAGWSEVRKVPVDMRAIVQELLGEIVPDERWDRFEIRVEELPAAYGDPELLRVVLQNLLPNAVKYAGKRERAVIEVGSRSAPDGTEYFVKDNGVGFDMKYSGKLFRVFQRLHGMSEFEGARDRVGPRQEDRRTVRRARAGRGRGGPGGHVLLHIAEGLGVRPGNGREIIS
jgi:light-regulated signal transduction histidine kinase (bacteriophytochrome)